MIPSCNIFSENVALVMVSLEETKNIKVFLVVEKPGTGFIFYVILSNFERGPRKEELGH